MRHLLIALILLPVLAGAADDTCYSEVKSLAPVVQARAQSRAFATDAATEAVGPARHDVLVLYTDSAIATAGIDALNAQTDANLAYTNQTYVDSGVNLTVVAVAKLRSPLQETGDMVQTQNALIASAEVKALRAQYYADIVLLITNHTSGWDGLGRLWYGYSNGIITFLDAHATIRWNRFAARTTAHELGHTQGLIHDRATEGGGVYGQYHYGYRVCGTGGFMDIMSYACSGATPLHQFSNPRLFFNGKPTGVDPAVDPANAADASRQLNENAALVSNFRNPPTTPTEPPPPVATVPGAPTDLTVTASGNRATQLTWALPDTRATAVLVQRAKYAPKQRKWSNWNGVTALPAGSTSYRDVVGQVGTYRYRVGTRNVTGTAYGTPVELYVW